MAKLNSSRCIMCPGSNNGTIITVEVLVRKSRDLSQQHQIFMEVTNMKKLLIILICVGMTFSLCACGGDVKNVNVVDAESEIYTSADIKSAIETIKKEFDIAWNGCTLTEIYYAGDEKSKGHQEWAERYDADEVLVLLSSFDVDGSGGDGSLNPNSTYDHWMWI
jgi:hypothetical protein